MKTPYLLTALLICLGCIRAPAQQTSSTDPEHFKNVDERGDSAMGFSHEMTSHHFLIFKDGGAIEVEADDPKDASNPRSFGQDPRHVLAGRFSAPYADPRDSASGRGPNAAIEERDHLRGGNHSKGRLRPD
jgi:hypothetical protein